MCGSRISRDVRGETRRPPRSRAATAAITSRFGAAGFARRGDAGLGGGRGQQRPLAGVLLRPPASSQQRSWVAGGGLALRVPQFYASVQGDDWRRRGLRSSGSEFTIGSITSYDVDVRQP